MEPPPRLVTTFRDRCSHSSRLLLSFFSFFLFPPPFFCPLLLFPPFSLYWQVIITSINGGARSIFTRSLSFSLFRFVGNLSLPIAGRTSPKYQRRTNERTSVVRVIRALTVSLLERAIRGINFAREKEITRKTARLLRTTG